MLDVVIANGKLVDGTGNPWYRADLGVKNGRIVAIGRELGEANCLIDATGLVVAPGFIDMHTHSDASLLADPRAQSAVQQGVTTEIIGNCGFSLYPHWQVAKRELDRLNSEPPYQDLESYFARVRGRGVAINVGALVGHSNVRATAMGEAARPASPDEVASMKRIITKAMEDGAFGLSSGLVYPPGCFADTDELVALAQVVAKYGGIYASHIRNEGEGIVAAVQEAVAIGERAMLPVQLSHHKAMGRPNWGLVQETLRIVEESRTRGVDVALDQNPYAVTMGWLSSFLPQWAYDGGKEALLKRLGDSSIRKRIVTELSQSDQDWNQVVLLSCPGHKEWQGSNVVEVGVSLGLPPEATVAEVLHACDGSGHVVDFCLSEEDVLTVMRHPLTIVATDGEAMATDGPLGELTADPFSFGTFARVLGLYVREKRALTVEEAVRKMTSAPAQRLGLRDRGLLREEMWADIVVFDPQAVADQTTFAELRQYPAGVVAVLVNGQVVIERGCHSGRLPGQALLKS